MVLGAPTRWSSGDHTTLSEAIWHKQAQAVRKTHYTRVLGELVAEGIQERNTRVLGELVAAAFQEHSTASYTFRGSSHGKARLHTNCGVP